MARRVTFALLLAGFLLLPNLFAADTARILSEQEWTQLAKLNSRIESAIDFGHHGYITSDQVGQVVFRCLEEASIVCDRKMSATDLNELVSSSPFAKSKLQTESTLSSRIYGLITFANIMYVMASFIFLFSAGHLVVKFLKFLLKILVNIPIWVYESGLYLASCQLMLRGNSIVPEMGSQIAFTGCLLFGGCLAFSCAKHDFNPNKSLFSLILACVWALVAVGYSSSLVGFISVAALLSAFGFSMMVYPGVCVMGFDDEDAVGKGTAAAFYLLGIFVAAKVLSAHASSFLFQYVYPLFGNFASFLGFAAGSPDHAQYLAPFEYGSIFLGSLVGYLGLLISSSRWYPRRNVSYLFAQVITTVAGLAALFIGSVFGIPVLLKVGGTFFVVYLLTKPWEIPFESADGFAFLGVCTSVAIVAFVWFVKTHTALVAPYLLFMS